MFKFIKRLLGRGPTNNLPPYNPAHNRWRAKRPWPPNMMALTEKQAFRFERKFKRRLMMKAVSPTWNKWVGIAQWSIIGTVVVYAVLFHDFANDAWNPRPGEGVFVDFRAWMKGLITRNWEPTQEDGAVAGQKEVTTQPASPPPNQASGRGRPLS
ncbi:hypothetical protein P154DRAFT_424899 [Amniculicola lignicola CBS 123094]|uniref:Transmembrane protein n=1 Tax=Amniculicola lignicola CBS 123094 TaxID=1392246 RepID=A0A6A5WTA2_9PLEO|nr:hypothetical protein P154DRAFT_424899 [Amniculicola lignicola CBS 123094]